MVTMPTPSERSREINSGDPADVTGSAIEMNYGKVGAVSSIVGKLKPIRRPNVVIIFWTGEGVFVGY